MNTSTPTVPQRDGMAGQSSLADAHSDVIRPQSRAILSDSIGIDWTIHMATHDRLEVHAYASDTYCLHSSSPPYIEVFGSSHHHQTCTLPPAELEPTNPPAEDHDEAVGRLPAVSLARPHEHAVSSLPIKPQLAIICETQTRPCVFQHQ